MNLAARLEPLCKQYGVTVLVSQAIADAAREKFVFRRVDRVAVKGKAQAIDVHELLGRGGDAIANLPQAERYERAFEAYLARDFATASEILAGAEDDPPSAVLQHRCRALHGAPPPEDWGGVHVARSK